MYKNYFDHPRYGRLWYTITVRNWNRMGGTVEDNLRAGPLCVLQVEGYSVVAHSRSPDMAVGQFLKTLDAYEKRDLELPTPMKRSWIKSMITRWRMNRLCRRWLRDGTMNPVRLPKKSLRKRIWRWLVDAAHLDTPS